MEAGADPTIPNKDGDLPADLLSYGTKSRSQLAQDLLARLKRGQAEININASDIANDDDVADDGEGKPIDADTTTCAMHCTDEHIYILLGLRLSLAGSEGTPSEE